MENREYTTEDLGEKINWRREYFDLRIWAEKAYRADSLEKARELLFEGLQYSEDIVRYTVALLEDLNQ